MSEKTDVHQLNVQVSSLEKMQLDRVCNKNMTYLGRCTLASQHEEKVRHAWPYTDRTLHTRHLIWKMHAAILLGPAHR
jgi:hypothetical protein